MKNNIKIHWSILLLLLVATVMIVLLFIYLADFVAQVHNTTHIRGYNATYLAYKPLKRSNLARDNQVEGVIREITAYNAGNHNQCDNDPCISASGDNICQLLDQGEKICAANFVEIGTELDIENYGRCVVLDRMNSRYKNRVDIAMRSDEVVRAIKFGKQNLRVIIK